ncbi:hypothetical protein GOBAR_DD13121 [Gossypium barbadense]|nr:hypothetical protein GOBAR_DD13121 [Gossypium barbadense]
MKQNISAKIAQHCGRRMSRVFYKFSVSSNPRKYREMELVEDDDVDTMIALYYLPGNVKPVELLIKLADVELVQNVTPLNRQYRVQDLYKEVPRVSVNRRSSIMGEDFSDLDLDEDLVDIDDEGASDDDNIQNFVGPHTCTVARMLEDHQKIDVKKKLCNYIMPLVKYMPTIPISVLIADIESQFLNRMSYRKAWQAKEMAMKQLYRY